MFQIRFRFGCLLLSAGIASISSSSHDYIFASWATRNLLSLVYEKSLSLDMRVYEEQR